MPPSLNTDPADPAALAATLETAAVRALARDWANINYSHLRRQLRPPTLVLSAAGSRLGQWTRHDRTIELARSLVLEQPWGVVVEVLKHEMAHQYADEALGAQGETAHGAAFRRGCELLGIDPAASGMPRGLGPSSDAEARVRSRIAKLLALAGSPEAHEAENAMREAQRLMLKYNLDETHAGRPSPYAFRHLGQPTGRLAAHQRMVATILGAHFFVETIWITVHRADTGTAGTVLEICGTDANLEMAAYVHDFLLDTAERLWRAHQRASGDRKNALRRSFLVGVMRGFLEKLDEERREQRREGLVWVSDPGLGSYFDRRYPRRQSLRAPTRAHPSAFAEGRQAGRTIVIHRPVGAGGGGPRLLPGRRR